MLWLIREWGEGGQGPDEVWWALFGGDRVFSKVTRSLFPFFRITRGRLFLCLTQSVRAHMSSAYTQFGAHKPRGTAYRGFAGRHALNTKLEVKEGESHSFDTVSEKEERNVD